jgi:hypothetical protein
MRKKSENRSSIIKPLHFGHSIDPSWVCAFTDVATVKQDLHQIVVFRDFKQLEDTYLPGSDITGLQH